MVTTQPVALTSDEGRRRDGIVLLLKGDSKSDRHLQDAYHIFEASKYSGYFVTTDNRILKLAPRIRELCSVQVLKPSEALRRMEI